MKSKSITPILLLVFVLFGLGNAQQVNVGVLGGINFADLNIKDDQGEKSNVSTRNTFGVGGIFELRLAQSVYLQLQPIVCSLNIRYGPLRPLELSAALISPGVAILLSNNSATIFASQVVPDFG